ncbi:MAG: winged helix-turn-helix domain-containing protein [Caldisphaera sp.]|jgi:DNA-binding transcriptional ArsR family regulator|nr:MAG: hypothetical protein C0201_01075 [Caldisphaera sp.]PMP92014.1 MAG: hypothetical protein C0171_01785 [Caldisphaera sp.]
MAENIDDKIIEKLLKIFKNPTKLSIIALLIKNKEMSVTQISKILNTTRSNLYQSIKDLLNDKIILLSRIQVNKNYVEKYYKLNFDLLDRVKSANLMEAIKKSSIEDFKDLTISFLIINSLISNILIDDLKRSSENKIKEFKEKWLNNNIYISMSFLTISDEEAKEFSSIIDKFINKVELNKETKIESHLLLVLLFPWFYL